jgi:hypothetical protein
MIWKETLSLTYERNTLESPIMVLLSYAKAANVYLEVIVNDKLFT